jgi:hypothetical protein
VITLTDDGESYELIRLFGDDRALINMRGASVFVDRVDAERFQISGTPARPGEELDELNAIVAPLSDVTIVTVTKP